MIKKYTDFEINEANTDAKAVNIKNEYTKIINDPKANAIDLGVVDDVSDTDIKNIQQTYKNSSIQVADGHYILLVDENTIIRFSEFEKINEDGYFDVFFNPEKALKKIEMKLTDEAVKLLATYEKRGFMISLLAKDGFEISPEKYQRLVNAILFKTGRKEYSSFSEDAELDKTDFKELNTIVDKALFIVDNN